MVSSRQRTDEQHPSKLSQRPRAARRRLRNTSERLEDSIQADIAIVYEKPINEWDWEELSHGRPRGVDGKFLGPNPKWITPAITAEAQRRMRTMTEQEVMVHASGAIKVLTDIMTNNEVNDFGSYMVPASVRVDAAKYVLNRILGTPTARVEMETHSPLESLMARALVNPDGENAHPVIDMPQEEDDGGE